MLRTILSISGKPGLYKLTSRAKNMLIVESLIDQKKIPAHAKDKVISLGDIAIYTEDGETPLHKVLTSVKELRSCPILTATVFIPAISASCWIGIISWSRPASTSLRPLRSRLPRLREQSPRLRRQNDYESINITKCHHWGLMGTEVMAFFVS